MLPHEEMFPSGDGVASPECSLRRSTLSVYSLVEGARRSEAVGEAKPRPFNRRRSFVGLFGQWPWTPLRSGEIRARRPAQIARSSTGVGWCATGRRDSRRAVRPAAFRATPCRCATAPRQTSASTARSPRSADLDDDGLACVEACWRPSVERPRCAIRSASWKGRRPAEARPAPRSSSIGSSRRQGRPTAVARS